MHFCGRKVFLFSPSPNRLMSTCTISSHSSYRYRCLRHHGTKGRSCSLPVACGCLWQSLHPARSCYASRDKAAAMSSHCLSSAKLRVADMLVTESLDICERCLKSNCARAVVLAFILNHKPMPGHPNKANTHQIASNGS